MHKSIIILAETLRGRPAEALNVMGHLSQAIGAQAKGSADARFVDYQDQEGGRYPGISWWPLICLSGRPTKMWAYWDELVSRDLPRGAFFETMLTGGSEEQVRKTAEHARPDLPLLGVAVFGEAAVLDPLGRKFSLWKA
ncbi:DUF2000 domain-containing protein [Caulobacter radicis]|uniref:DUF2000 family protein n=1 Tax=Caulobacter radicis TaxID=2172650 RepID=UPI000D573C67|nr:DUF2000 family protein [Caulobacter radicis]PVM88392.1 DUF2000 domain-containing protein [Caulobacter radicis]